MKSSMAPNVGDKPSVDDRRVFAQRVMATLADGRVDPGWPIVPYPGVRSFTSDEQTIFFGREEDARNIREKLSFQGCVFVLGGSGSGKSSLVRAGLVPRIVSGSPIDDRKGPWYVLRFTPGMDPFASLARAFISEIYGISDLPIKPAKKGQGKHALRRLQASENSFARILKRSGANRESATLESREILESTLANYLRRRYQNRGEELADFLYLEVDRFHADFARSETGRATNLIVIIDQFEEVFRDGVDPNGAQTIIRMMERSGLPRIPGLYFIATMRSEEVHRSVDYPDLTALIDRTGLLVDLPDSDETFEAITRSARIVLQLAGFDDEADRGIEVDVAERMLDAVEALAAQRAQRADQLPLLQNALRELWRHAAERWARDPATPFVITKQDLFSLPLIADSDGVPDLAACLNRVADSTFEQAMTVFPTHVSEQDRKGLLEVAFVRLEQPDDRGNPARAFATAAAMIAAYGKSWPTAKEDLEKALDVFVKGTMLQRFEHNSAVVFDVSHEAVIRNWTKYARWVDEADAIRRVIGRILEDVWDKETPPGASTRFEKGQWTPDLSLKQCRDLITPNQSIVLQSVRLPTGGFLLSQCRYFWEKKVPELVGNLTRSAVRRTHGIIGGLGGRHKRGDVGNPAKSVRPRKDGGNFYPKAIKNLLGAVGQFFERRMFKTEYVTQDELIESSRSETEQQAVAARRPRQGASPKFGSDWLVAAIVPLFERRWRRRKQFLRTDLVIEEEVGKIKDWLIRSIDKARFAHQMRLVKMSAVSVIVVVILGMGILAQRAATRADQEAKAAKLQSTLARASSINAQKYYLESKVNTFLSFYFELQRDEQRAQGNETSLVQAKQEAEKTTKFRKAALTDVDALGLSLTDAISKIGEENRRLWDGLDKPNRDEVINNVAARLTSIPYNKSEQKLRVALYAIAAIPEENPILMNLLYGIIEKGQQRASVRARAASQIWGLAFTKRKLGPQVAAAGDENGILWIWEPSEGLAEPQNLTAGSGAVNGIAFNADASLLAAAYRSGGVAVWDLSKATRHPLCSLRPAAENFGAYGVAFSGTLVAIASGDKAVHLWDASQQGCPAVDGKVFRRKDIVFGVGFSPDGKLVAAASGDGTVAVWDINSPEQPLLDEQLSNKPMFAVAFSPDGKTLAATGAGGNGYLWKREGDIFDNPPKVLLSAGGTLGQISFSPDGRRVVATASSDGTAVVTPLTMDTLQSEMDGNGQGLFGVAFSPDSRYLLTASHLSNTVRLLEIDDAQAWKLAPLPDLIRKQVLISRGVERVSRMQLDKAECTIFQKMQIPIFNVIQWDNPLVCPYPFLGAG